MGRFLKNGLFSKTKRILFLILLYIRRARRKGCHFLFRLISCVPILSQYLPTFSLTTFKMECTNLESFPANEENFERGYYIRIRNAETLKWFPPICLNDNSERVQFPDKYEIPEVFLASIPKARILDSFLVISPDNRIFLDSIWSQNLLKESGVLYSIKLPSITYKFGNYILIGMYWWEGYYHWVLDILPRLSLIEQFEELRSVPLIVPKGMAPNQYESLRLLGISPDRTIEYDGSHWEVDRVYFPSPLSGTGNPSPWAISWLRSRLLSVLGVQDAKATKYFYITRRDAYSRKITNEDQIVESLTRRGFEVICPGELSFAEQVQHFAQAKVIIGPHGAGLTNMVFAPPNSILIELFPESYINVCYWALANVCHNTYAFLKGNPKGSNFEISLGEIENLLDKMIAHRKEGVV